MAKMSKAEVEFRAMYPHTNVRKGDTGKFEVYAGDYLVEASYYHGLAFKKALYAVNEGLVNPDPEEKVGSFPEPEEELLPEPAKAGTLRMFEHVTDGLFVKMEFDGQVTVLRLEQARKFAANLTKMLAGVAA